ncbi:peptidyl-tRNA hydrolase [Holospora obtusa F1]|uniref:Peptidyl-tRNA hydrolase n=1 Tax=Holospora obtusa F1 TaxID=1399147 RepID=W6TDD8_HOLOB|nr:aminoacyl-tRNA hydrolase [Holospora obtusa]ETZ06761.1 peptidyl-tRNA hydrolase [Holospora obtusa F1]
MRYDWVWVGIGNPGSEYDTTRHNAGFLALDALKERFQDTLEESKKWEKKYNAFVSVLFFQEFKVLLCKPLSYVNRSGAVVSSILKMFNIPLDHVVVFHDELELDFGVLKWKTGGGHKGHNGLRNISELCGSDYNRFCIGIGRPRGAVEVSKFVLSSFTPKELEILNVFVFPCMHRALPYLFQGKFDKIHEISKDVYSNSESF